MEKTKWLIWSIEHTAWWCPDSKGYTSFLPDAGIYTYERATQIVKGANYCLTLPKQKKKFHKELNTPFEAMILLTDELKKLIDNPYGERK